MLTPSRRSFITGMAALIAAPAIVRASSLMPVRGIIMDAAPQYAAGSLYGELCAVTRQAFVPRLFVQIWASSPALNAMLQPGQQEAVELRA
jgi:hypothetical protein